jgi:hypothetical protein
MDAKTIAVQVEQAAREAFDDGKFYELRRSGRIATTAAIKQTFHDLGVKLGFGTAWSWRGWLAAERYGEGLTARALAICPGSSSSALQGGFVHDASLSHRGEHL